MRKLHSRHLRIVNLLSQLYHLSKIESTSFFFVIVVVILFFYTNNNFFPVFLQHVPSNDPLTSAKSAIISPTISFLISDSFASIVKTWLSYPLSNNICDSLAQASIIFKHPLILGIVKFHHCKLLSINNSMAKSSISLK